MSREIRAVLFDLDDTLYPRRRFVLSGFAAITAQLARDHGVDRQWAFAILRDAWRSEGRGHELERLVERLPAQLAGDSLVPTVAELVSRIREHAPSLRLPRSSAAVLQALRQRYRLGIVTNGIAAVQRRKIVALQVGAMVDTVVCATEHGSGYGKPDPQPFLEALRRLGVAPRQAIFVGDDERCDVGGAAAAGLRTVRVRRAGEPTAADAGIGRLDELPLVLDAVGGDTRGDTGSRHAA